MIKRSIFLSVSFVVILHAAENSQSEDQKRSLLSKDENQLLKKSHKDFKKLFKTKKGQSESDFEKMKSQIHGLFEQDSETHKPKLFSNDVFFENAHVITSLLYYLDLGNVQVFKESHNPTIYEKYKKITNSIRQAFYNYIFFHKSSPFKEKIVRMIRASDALKKNIENSKGQTEYQSPFKMIIEHVTQKLEPQRKQKIDQKVTILKENLAIQKEAIEERITNEKLKLEEITKNINFANQEKLQQEQSLQKINNDEQTNEQTIEKLKELNNQVDKQFQIYTAIKNEYRLLRRAIKTFNQQVESHRKPAATLKPQRKKGQSSKLSVASKPLQHKQEQSTNRGQSSNPDNAAKDNNWMEDIFNKVGDNLGELGDKFYDALDDMRNKADGLINKADGLINDIFDPLPEALDEEKNKLEKQIENFCTKHKLASCTILNSDGSISDKIIDALSTFVKQKTAALHNFDLQLWNSIKNKDDGDGGQGRQEKVKKSVLRDNKLKNFVELYKNQNNEQITKLLQNNEQVDNHKTSKENLNNKITALTSQVASLTKEQKDLEKSIQTSEEKLEKTTQENEKLIAVISNNFPPDHINVVLKNILNKIGYTLMQKDGTEAFEDKDIPEDDNLFKNLFELQGLYNEFIDFFLIVSPQFQINENELKARQKIELSLPEKIVQFFRKRNSKKPEANESYFSFELYDQLSTSLKTFFSEPELLVTRDCCALKNNFAALSNQAFFNFFKYFFYINTQLYSILKLDGYTQKIDELKSRLKTFRESITSIESFQDSDSKMIQEATEEFELTKLGGIILQTLNKMVQAFDVINQTNDKERIQVDTAADNKADANKNEILFKYMIIFIDEEMESFTKLLKSEKEDQSAKLDIQKIAQTVETIRQFDFVIKVLEVFWLPLLGQERFSDNRNSLAIIEQKFDLLLQYCLLNVYESIIASQMNFETKLKNPLAKWFPATTQERISQLLITRRLSVFFYQIGMLCSEKKSLNTNKLRNQLKKEMKNFFQKQIDIFDKLDSLENLLIREEYTLLKMIDS